MCEHGWGFSIICAFHWFFYYQKQLTCPFDKTD